jgi:hypothetical protein
LESAGTKITQPAVITALHKVKSFSAGGMVAPTNPSSKTTGISCYIVWQFENGSFNRTSADPASSYRCDGRYVTS